MNGLLLILLVGLKIIGFVVIGLIQLTLICILITKLTNNKHWLRNDINRLRNYLNKGIYN